MSHFFKLHVIPPPAPLDWASPRGLLLKTLWHHLIQDEAPIGHFFIEIASSTPNRFGVRRVVTGMSRQARNRSTLKVIQEQVGLGSFFYDFAGKLDRGVDAVKELDWAATSGRLKTVLVPTTEDRAHLLFDELNEWIVNGGFRHYGGGHQIIKGEGAGCAEMGAHFFNLALGVSGMPSDWIRSVYAPKALTGGHRTGQKVGMFKVIREGTSWAKGPEDGILYATPDMELTWGWLERHYPGESLVTLTPEALGNPKKESPRIQFEAGYPKEAEQVVLNQWSLLKVD